MRLALYRLIDSQLWPLLGAGASKEYKWVADATCGYPMREMHNYSVKDIYESHDAALKTFLECMSLSEDEVRDIRQDVYLRISQLGNLGQFVANPRAYLFQIAKNLVRDRYRRRKVRNAWEQPVDGEPDAIAPEPSPEAALEIMDQLQVIRKSIVELDPKVRKVLYLSRIEKRKYSEISQELGISVRTVKRYVAESMEFLKSKLDEH